MLPWVASSSWTMKAPKENPTTWTVLPWSLKWATTSASMATDSASAALASSKLMSAAMNRSGSRVWAWWTLTNWTRSGLSRPVSSTSSSGPSRKVTGPPWVTTTTVSASRLPKLP